MYTYNNLLFFNSNNLLPPKKDKEPKQKKLQPQIETLVPDVVVEEVRTPEPLPTFEAPKEEKLDGEFRFY